MSQTKWEGSEPQQQLNERAKRWGNKAANLQELVAIFQSEEQVVVPDFCPLSHELIQAHLDKHSCEPGGWRSILAEFQSLQGVEKADITLQAKDALSRLRKVIMETFCIHPIDSSDLIVFLNKMAEQHTKLMVRSSGDEDTLDVANPGGNETMSAVEPTVAAVSDAMGRVVASYFSEKSLKQRLLSPQKEITHAFTPVLLQEMVGEPINGFNYSHQVIRSGVMYTKEEGAQIQIAPGHGELVVDSKALFDTFTVTHDGHVYSEINRKPYRLVPTEHGLDWKKNPKALQDNACIPAAVAIRLAKIGQQIARHYKMPIDVEFIYDPKLDLISIVQARPIPSARARVVVPSSVPFEKIPALKESIRTGQIQQMSTEVITPAGFAAKIITHKEQALVCETLDEALNIYLKQINSPVQSVVVRQMAPATSHAAAQFSAMAIPVMQVDDISRVRAWLGETNLVLMVDPQRNQILNCTQVVDDLANATEVLTEQGYLAEGMFTYPISPTTDQPVFVDATTLERLFKQIKSMPIDKAHIYTQMLASIETLEAIVPKQSNDSALIELDRMRYILYLLAKSQKGNVTFFGQVVLLCEEIEHSLSRISSLSKDTTPEYVTMLKEEHLSLVARLKSFVTYPGNRDTFSNSIKQVYQEQKAQNAAVDSAALSSPYFTQFLKLNKIAFNPESRRLWTQLVTHCLKGLESTQQLSQIVKFYVENHLESDLINHALVDIMQKDVSLSVVLKTLYDDCMQSKEEFSRLQLEKSRQLINTWTQRIEEWAKPQQFETLWSDYKKDMSTLTEQLSFNAPLDFVVMDRLPKRSLLETIPGTARFALVSVRETAWIYFVDKTKKTIEQRERSYGGKKEYVKKFLQALGINGQTSQVIPVSATARAFGGYMVPWEGIPCGVDYQITTQKVVLNLVLRLTDLMDKTIKSLKGSPDYLKEDEALLVERFVQLLKPYYHLMADWMIAVPDHKYAEWYQDALSMQEPSEYRYVMIDGIGEALNRKNRDSKELAPSGNVSVASAKLGSGASFERQFSVKAEQTDGVTFEDTFSLIHQNTLSAVAVIKSELVTTQATALPDDLKSLWESFNQKYEGEVNLELLSMGHEFPMITLEYNLPMFHHSAQFTIQYNQQTQQVQLHGHVFGANWESRMNFLIDAIKLDGLIFGMHVTKPPVYSDQALALDFIWEFPTGELSNLTDYLYQSFVTYNYVLSAGTTDASERDDKINSLLYRYPNIPMVLSPKSSQQFADAMNSSLMVEEYNEMLLFMMKRIMASNAQELYRPFLTLLSKQAFSALALVAAQKKSGDVVQLLSEIDKTRIGTPSSQSIKKDMQDLRQAGDASSDSPRAVTDH